MRPRQPPTNQSTSPGGPRRLKLLLEDVTDITISADQFIDWQFDRVQKCENFTASIIFLKQADVAEVYSAHGEYQLHLLGLVEPLVLKDSAEATSFVMDILPQFKRARLASEMKIKDVSQCSLDYVELACVIMKYIKMPFGRLTPSAHQQFLASLRSEGVKTVLHNVDAWVAGCILRTADVPLERLKIACLNKLQFRPSAYDCALECLKRKWLSFNRYIERLSADHRDPNDYLNGFKGKPITAAEFFRIQTLRPQEKDSLLRQLCYRPVPGPQNSGAKREAEEPGLPNQGVKRIFLEQVASQQQQLASQEQVIGTEGLSQHPYEQTIADQLMHKPIDQLTDQQPTPTAYLSEGSGEKFWGSGVQAYCPNPQTVRNTEPSIASVLGVFAEEMQRITPPNYLPEFGGLPF